MGALALLAAVSSSSRILGIVLWVGVAILTLAFLIVARTRWGQAKPMSKCVALSVFVHILFLSYAYGTRLIFDFPAAQDEPAMQVQLLAASSDELAEAQSRPQPWEGLDSKLQTEPAWEQLERTQAEVETLERQGPSSVAGVNQMPLSEPPAEAPARPEADRPALVMRPEVAPAVEVQVQPPVARRPQEELPPTPLPEQLDRLTDSLATPAMPEPSAPRGVPSDLLKIDSQLQQLEQYAGVAASAHAAGADRDQLQGSVNQQGGGTENRSAESHVAATKLAAPSAERSAALHGSVEAVLPQPAELIKNLETVRRLADGQFMPEPYRLRMQPRRSPVLASFGGNERTEAAVEGALAWLAVHQSADGRWDPRAYEAGQEVRINGQDRQGAGADADAGITALALLAFLGSGHTHLEGKYRKNVQYGLEYLLEIQRSDGCLAGNAQLFASMYCHGMATLAISEAYAMTGDERLKAYVERAVGYTIASQHPSSGGWRYQPGDLGDMSQFGWQVMALRSAELAGLTIPTATRQGMARFLRQASSGIHGGLASYRPGERPTRTMTAEALACRFFLRTLNDPSTIGEAADFIVEELPGESAADLYYWYYATLSLFHLHDEHWQRWNEAVQQHLLSSQRTDGDMAGSWDPDGVWGRYGGRVYSTALSALCLEVYYRYLPSFVLSP